MLLALFIWPVIVLDIWTMALVGPVFFVLGIINLFHPIPGLWMGGKPVATHGQAIRWVISTAVISIVGILLAVWHWRWRRHHKP